MKRDAFLKYFPVPKYLELPTVGIDISDNSIRYIELIKSGEYMKLGRYGKKMLDSAGGVYTHDETIENDNLRHELVGLIEKNFFGTVNASLPEDHAYFLRLRLPWMEAPKVREAIELQIEDHVPYLAEEVIFDYEIVNGNKSTQHIDTTVSIIPRLVAEKYLTTLQLAGLEVASLSIESDAMIKAVVPRDAEETFIVVNIGKNKTVISVVNGGTIWISDTIKAGGDLLTELIIKYLKVERSVAENIKYEKGLSEIKDNLAFEPLALGLSSIRDEIIRYNMYWMSDKEATFSGERKVHKVILCGRDANIPGIDNYLSSSLKISTVIANPWVNVESFEKHIPDLLRGESLEYVTAIGLALNNLV